MIFYNRWFAYCQSQAKPLDTLLTYLAAVTVSRRRLHRLDNTPFFLMLSANHRLYRSIRNPLHRIAISITHVSVRAMLSARCCNEYIRATWRGNQSYSKIRANNLRDNQTEITLFSMYWLICLEKNFVRTIENLIRSIWKLSRYN